MSGSGGGAGDGAAGHLPALDPGSPLFLVGKAGAAAAVGNAALSGARMGACLRIGRFQAPMLCRLTKASLSIQSCAMHGCAR